MRDIICRNQQGQEKIKGLQDAITKGLQSGISNRTMQDILEAKDRRAAGRTAPPHGLYLTRVLY